MYKSRHTELKELAPNHIASEKIGPRLKLRSNFIVQSFIWCAMALSKFPFQRKIIQVMIMPLSCFYLTQPVLYYIIGVYLMHT